MKFLRVGAKDRARLHASLEALEAIATYPLGQDSFKISHGADYFAFFDRLGELHYHAAVDGERVAAVGAGVVRKVPFGEGGPLRPAWYLCDLKTHPDFRGRHLPLKLLSSAFLFNYLRCPRGYAITMNPGDGSPNRIVRLMKHFRWAPARVATTLQLFSLDSARMAASQPILVRHRGPVSYLSLSGKKDIVLESTRQPMKLLHAQFGPCAEAGQPAPADGAVHMFCVPEGDALLAELRTTGLEPSASATVIEHRMKGCDWRFVLTSDI
jgi:hypothetical protein